jgi:hypothetical protein
LEAEKHSSTSARSRGQQQACEVANGAGTCSKTGPNAWQADIVGDPHDALLMPAETPTSAITTFKDSANGQQHDSYFQKRGVTSDFFSTDLELDNGPVQG